MRIETRKIVVDGDTTVSSEWAVPDRYLACRGGYAYPYDRLSPSRMVLSGKSLGARMASMLIIADSAFDCIAGVVPA